MKLAAVTMVYNEPDYMARWCRHYGQALGPENCYVIDHGSDDGTTDDLGPVNVARLARSPMDDTWRARLVSDFCADLLNRYDAVVHSDVDELLVVDPRRHASLADCARAMPGPVLHAIGLEVWHLADEEPPIDIDRPVSAQRQWVWPHAALCKPALITEAVDWAPGFHSVAAPLSFGALHLFHLRYTDIARGLRRLARSRSMAWANDHQGLHQRCSDEDWLAQVAQVASFPRLEQQDFDDTPMQRFVLGVLLSQRGREESLYRHELHLHGGALIRLPERFQGLF